MPTASPRSTILIVEAEPDLREVMAELLESEGYQVLQTSNGRDALDVLATLGQPCLVLLDLMMPVMDGNEFLHHVQQDARLRELPVLMFNADYLVQAPAGTVGLLRKPAHLAELMAAVALHCPTC
ncbi:response regulator [Corallococcus sp. bb12-1]|uniref:response regulator n=1 Tax=Corallococcus sp. bb12-1 TaxID=2996784 RepID=UPI002270E0D8|nr:response regulator [Corallococcus sp. bb12-1]MCY1043323.1 response regulator [Corallococcus sp. bb12-1]